MKWSELILKIKTDLMECITKDGGEILVDDDKIREIVIYINSLTIDDKPISKEEVKEILNDLKESLTSTKSSGRGFIKEAADAQALMLAYSSLMDSIEEM